MKQSWQDAMFGLWYSALVAWALAATFNFGPYKYRPFNISTAVLSGNSLDTELVYEGDGVYREVSTNK